MVADDRDRRQHWALDFGADTRGHTYKSTLTLDRSPWLRVYDDEVRLADGRVVPDFVRIDAPDYVVVFAVTPDRRCLLVRQFKPGLRKEVLQFPAGYVEPGESPADAARRELTEETGFASPSLEGLGSFVVDGNRGMGSAHLFLARGAYKVEGAVLDVGEIVEVVQAELDDVATMYATGEFGELSMVATVAIALPRINSVDS